ncbi:MAG: protein kinase [Wenzhouxiangellaceae bacterium]
MTLDAATWSRVTEIFERVAELSPAERNATIEDFAPDAVVREWLDKLLTAHDDPDELLIDRTVKGVVEALADDEPPEAEAAPDAPVQLGPWRLVEEIATGGMGRVMLGERCDGRYEQRVAVKLLAGRSRSAADAELLDREIRLLARLEHPGIVRLIDGGLTGAGQPYLVMEYVDGEPIDEWCRRRQASLNQRVELLRQLADALSHAHRRLIVHADIKPSNVLVDKDGRVRVLDFGIGELIRERAGPEGRALRCSPAWCAPEQLLGTSSASVAQDVFGLGALLLRLLTGRRVREGSRITRWLGGTISADTEHPPPPSTALLQHLPRARVRGDLDAICLRALAAEPEVRYASVDLFDADLRAWKDKRPVAARPLAPPARLARWARRHWVPVAAATITLGGLLTGIVLANSSARQMQIAADQARVEAERADAVRDFVLDLFRAADPLRAGGAELSTRQVLAGAGEALERSPELSGDARLEVLNVLADVQRTMGWTDDAESLLAQAMHLVETDPALAPEARAETRIQLGLAEVEKQEFDQALAQFRQAEVELGALETPAATRVRARAHTNIGSVLARLGRDDEANNALDRAEALLAILDPPMLELELVVAAARGVAA